LVPSFASFARGGGTIKVIIISNFNLLKIRKAQEVRIKKKSVLLKKC